MFLLIISMFSLSGQVRLSESGKDVRPNMKERFRNNLDHVVSGLGIDVKVELPSLLHRAEEARKEPLHQAFPVSAVPNARTYLKMRIF